MAIKSLMLVLVIAFTGVPSSFAAKEAAKKEDRYENLELFQKVLHYIEANYVEEVKNKDLIHGAIQGMLSKLDPHSNFLPKDVFLSMKNETSGKFGGVGIEVGMKDDYLTVLAPIEDSPAYKAGIQPNDRIVKINGESTKGLNLVESISKMRGDKGTSLTLTIFREGFEKSKDVKIVRDTIKIVSVKSEEIDKNYGYVRLASFNESAAADIKKAIEKLEKSGKLKGLVLDLRTNPGGLLDQAVEVSSLFVDEGVIVSTIGRNKDQKEVTSARKGSARKDFPMAVLVNSSSASAAEIVAGALQDHSRAIIMGRPTFGKGSVQQVIELGNEVGLKLTIARYYTPKGRSIQEKGVSPDILLDEFDPKLLKEAKKSGDGVRERDLRLHLKNPSKDKEGKDDEEADEKSDDFSVRAYKPKEDFQVKEAVNYLKSWELFKKMGETPKEVSSSAHQ
jgi:carboxyl-terminal processing protease